MNLLKLQDYRNLVGKGKDQPTKFKDLPCNKIYDCGSFYEHEEKPNQKKKHPFCLSFGYLIVNINAAKFSEPILDTSTSDTKSILSPSQSNQFTSNGKNKKIKNGKI